MAKRRSIGSAVSHSDLHEAPEPPESLTEGTPQHLKQDEQASSLGALRQDVTPSFEPSHQDMFSMAQDFEMPTVMEAPLETQSSVILRVDREVLVHQWTEGSLRYVAGTFSDLNWAALEGLARAVRSLLPRALSVELDDVISRCGFIIGPASLCPAARFSLSGQAQSKVDHRGLIDAIRVCIGQLQNPTLWDHAKPTTDDIDENMTWRAVEAARRARMEIPGARLPFSCTVTTADTGKTFKITPELARPKPRRTETNGETAVGVLTGYCTFERIIKFKPSKGNTSIAIGFNEEDFLDSVFEFAGRNPHIVEVTWLNVIVDGVVSHRSLQELNSLVPPLSCTETT